MSLDLIPDPPDRAFVDGEVAYILEVYAGGQRQRSTEIPFVSAYDVDEGANVDLTHTFGEPWRVYSGAVNPDGSVGLGFRERRITITGNSGVEHRLGHDADGGRSFASGSQLFLYFRKFLENFARDNIRWQQENAFLPPQARAPQPRLVLRALDQGENYSCDARLRAPRQGIGTFWTYTLDVRAWGPAPQRTLTLLESIFGTVRGWAKTATDFIDSASAWVAYSAEVVDSTTATAATLTQPIAALGRLGQQLSNLARAGKSVQQLPALFVNATFQAAQDGLDGVVDLADTFTFGTMSAELDAFRRDSANRMTLAQMSALQYLGVRGQRLATVDSATMSATGALTAALAMENTPPTNNGAVTQVQLAPGDSLLSLLTTTYGSLANLPDVLALNGMSDAWTNGDGSPVVAGQPVLLPGSVNPMPSSANPADLYGTDLAFSQADADLVAPGTDPTDWLTVTGRGNILQATTNRLKTTRGDFAVFPSVGLSVELGQPNAGITRGLVAADVREQMLADRRIASVSPVAVDDSTGTGIVVDFTFHPITGPGIDVSVPVATG